MIIIIWYLNDCNEKESQRPRMLLGAHVALRYIETLSRARELCPVLSDDGKVRSGSGAESADIRVEDIHNPLCARKAVKVFFWLSSIQLPEWHGSGGKTLASVNAEWTCSEPPAEFSFGCSAESSSSCSCVNTTLCQCSGVSTVVSTLVWAQLLWVQLCEYNDVSSVLQIGTGQLLAWAFSSKVVECQNCGSSVAQKLGDHRRASASTASCEEQVWRLLRVASFCEEGPAMAQTLLSL